MDTDDGINEMTPEQAEKKIKSLRQEVDFHNFRYYVLDDPIISDAGYDALFRQLADLEKRFPEFVSPDSPTQRVGAPPLESFQTIEHGMPMLSLSNALSEEEVLEYDGRIKRFLNRAESIEYVVEPKLDGLAVELVYEKGRFVKGSTRGDGYRGEDVTFNLKTIKSIPLRLIVPPDLPLPEILEARGEVILTREDFARLNRMRAKEGATSFANPRNAAAGSIRQLDSSVTARRPLDIFFYGVGRIEGLTFETHWETLETLKKLGLKTTAHSEICLGIEAVLEKFRKMHDIRNALPFEIDGLVVKVNSLKLQEELGTISRSPRWALAVKFPPHQETTVIREIIAQVGRTGSITPVAVLDAVNVGGVEVRRATLHNQDEIDRKDIRLGDTVIIQRAGDVIPEVVKVIVEKRSGNPPPYQLPARCPACGSRTIKEEETVAVRCPNISCPARIEESIKHFASRRAMDIEGLGDKLVHQLVKSGLVRDVADLYNLSREELLPLDRLAERSSDNLLSAIDGSRKTTLPRFIFALGIRHVGEHLAGVLSQSFGSLKNLCRVSEERLMSVREIGPEVARSIRNFFNDEANLEVLKKLEEAGLSIGKVPETTGMLAGRSFVFTGALSTMTREDARNRVEQQGGKVSSSLSSKVDFVVVGSNPGSKLDRARQMGLKMISEEEFIYMTG